MMHTQHTQGPWTCTDAHFVRSASGNIISEVYNHIAPGYLANASLIAAAPELLDACQEAHRRMQVGNEVDNPTYHKLGSAIARAIGNYQERIT